ncbi:MAG: hypothetical protein IH937_02550 [Acidobacteria bacterium]|nr:hypothetical protein [Acidobacteriota bacterium]
MNRRDFFLLRKPEEWILELSCEELYMRYLDSQLDGTRNQFIERTRKKLRNRRKIRLYDAFWLDRGGVGEELEPLLREFRARGGSVEYV